MRTSVICRIEREIDEEKKELRILEHNIEKLRDGLIEKVPSKFSTRDVINAFFGALFLGLTFVLKGGQVAISMNMELIHVFSIIAVTLLILMAEIYFISYVRVKDRTKRHLSQFMTKRLLTLYGITLIVTIGLVYIFNLNTFPGIDNDPYNIAKMIIATSFPCAIGAAVPSLLKKY